MLTESETILFKAANNYLKGVMHGKTTILTKAGRTEYDKLTAEKKTLNQRYFELKEEVKEVGQIRKSVYSILRQEQRKHESRRIQDMERLQTGWRDRWRLPCRPVLSFEVIFEILLSI